jgi:hypothetical protein
VGPSSRLSANLKDFNHQDQSIGTVWLAQFIDWRALHGVPISSKIILSEFKHTLQHQSSRQRLVEIPMCCLGEDRAPVRDELFFGLHCYRVRSKVELLQHAEGLENIATRQHASSLNQSLPCDSMHRVQISGGSVAAPTVGSCLRWKIQLFENLLHAHKTSPRSSLSAHEKTTQGLRIYAWFTPQVYASTSTLPRLLTSTSLNQKTSRGWLPRHRQLVGSTSD